jgi:hypothetical protein
MPAQLIQAGCTIGLFAQLSCRRAAKAARKVKAAPLVAACLLPIVPALSAWAMPETRVAPPAVPAIAAAGPGFPLPVLLRPISKGAAIDINRSIPFSNEPNAPAQPFRLSADSTARNRAIFCLTAAIYYEAGNEPEEGKRAVAQVVLNRVRHPAFSPSVCGVVFEGSTLPTGCQFTFTCDGSLLRIPERRSLAQAQAVAERALAGEVFGPVGLSTHYHADYVVPYWASSLAKAVQIGTHIFYRWPRGWGDLSAFQRRYAGYEPDPAGLRAAALMAHAGFADGGDALAELGIELTSDPRIELIGVIGTLASPDAERGDRYSRDVRAYFGGASEDPAVQLLRNGQVDLPGGEAQPDAQTLTQSLGEFNDSSNFGAFYAGHRKFYREALAQAARELTPAVIAWESYTGIRVRGRRIAVGIGLADRASICLAGKLAATPFWVSSAGKPASDNFVDAGLADEILQPQEPRRRRTRALRIDPSLEREIVRAVFIRIAASEAGRAVAFSEPTSSDALVLAIAARLGSFERNRDRYPTLAEFLPELLKGGLARRSAPEASADQEITPDSCAAAQIASAK